MAFPVELRLSRVDQCQLCLATTATSSQIVQIRNLRLQKSCRFFGAELIYNLYIILAAGSTWKGADMSSEKYEIGTRAECEKMVKEWGFPHVFTWTDSR
jgi:hypothetical protein